VSGGGTVGTAARGATILTLATLGANLGNYAVNVMLGRWLTAEAFSDATLMVTLMLAATALAVSLQLVAAKTTTTGGAGLAGWLTARASLVGAGLGIVLAVGSPILSSFFNTSSAVPFVVLGIGMPFYVMQSVGRGVLQGRLEFGRLAATFVVEVVVRATLSICLVDLGFGVVGATMGLTASFIGTWAYVSYACGYSWSPISERARASVFSAARPVALLLVAQVVINNEDVFFSKRYLEPAVAGRYGAVALIGRGVFFAAWAVATAVFPVAAARTETVGRADRLLMAALGAVLAIGLTATVGAALFGNVALGRVFGEEYEGLAGPLSAYALATTCFAVANLFATYHLSLGNNQASLILLGGAVVQTIALLVSHDGIGAVVNAQLVSMALLATVVVGHHFLAPLPKPRTQQRMATA
jgi:O-antigen/teichoic acid export membrane protein